MSGAWSIYVILLSLLVVGGSAWLLAVTAKKTEKKEGETTGHVWDGVRYIMSCVLVVTTCHVSAMMVMCVGGFGMIML